MNMEQKEKNLGLELIYQALNGGKNPYGWPLGRIVSGRELFEEIRSKYLSREIMHNKQLVKEIKVWK